MTNAPRPSRFAISLFAAIATGAAGIILLLRRLTRPVPEDAPPVHAPVETIIVEEIPVEEALVPQASIIALVTSAAGLICWIAAQSHLLNSRHPVTPLILFILGFILIHPMLIFHEQRWQFTHDEPHKVTWPKWNTLMRDHAREIVAVAVLTVLSALFQFATPLSSPFSSIGAVLLVPVVYILGYTHLGTQVGLIAAGFAAVNGWALALGHTPNPYIWLAVVFGLYLVAIHEAYVDRAKTVWLVVLFLAGLLAITIFIVVNQSPTDSPNVPGNPQYTFTEALFNSLLMFNLTSDPNPLHGIVNRPAFSPILAASFLIGLMGLAWRLNARRKWLDTFLLLGLIIGLLPSAFLLTPPVRYPDIQQAAMALPVALVIAAFGLSLCIQLLTDRLGKVGVLLATALIIVALTLILSDARFHYINVFLPTYEINFPS